MPCPIVPVAPQPPAPTPSPLPTHDPGWPAIGGETLATTGLAVPDGAPPLPTVLSATSWVVADLDSGDVVGACAPHAFAAPASLQKLLLALAVLPKLNPADVVTVTAEDLNYEPGSSSVGLLLGGQYTVETLWLGLLLNSGNDAANVLARLGGGAAGVTGGLKAMNDKAEEIGALETHAETPSGLDGPGQATSAYDLALITRELFEREDFRRYVSTRAADMPAQPHLVELPETQAPGLPVPERKPAAHQLSRCAGRQDGVHRHRPAHVRRCGRARRPPAGRDAAGGRAPAGAHLAAGGRAARLGVRGRAGPVGRSPRRAG